MEAMEAAFCRPERVTLAGSTDTSLKHIHELIVSSIVTER